MRNVLVDDDESGRVYGHNEAVPELSQRLHFLPDAIEFRVRRKFSRLLTTVCLGLAGPEIQTQRDGLIHNSTHPRFERERDRKSTRLNSSHSQISYAVFCLKKKKKTPSQDPCLEQPKHGHVDFR